MPATTFEDGETALGFLLGEQQKADDFTLWVSEVAHLAVTALSQRGAYVFGVGGLFDRRAGTIGGNRPHTRAIQGTEPISCIRWQICCS